MNSYNENVDMLTFRDFSITFRTIDGGVKALDKINLSLKKGEILGIIGESGSGKTTVAMSTLHLLQDADISGNILYKDKPIYDDGERDFQKVSRKSRKILDQRLINIRWKEIAIVFQGAMNAFNPVKTIRSQIEEVFKVHRTFEDLENFTEADYVDLPVLKERAHEEFISMNKENSENLSQISEDEIYRRMVDSNVEVFKNGDTRLKRKLLLSNRIEKVSRIANFNTSFLDSYPHELSGGMRQRGILAMALALFPSILVADEPTTGLDAITQAKIIKEFKKLKMNKIVDAMIVISHDVGVIAQLADKVAVMYAGRIMEYGTPNEIFNSPLNPYTYALVNSYPSLSTEKRWVGGIPGHVPSLLDLPKGCYFADRCFMADKICFNTEPPMKSLPGGRLTKCHFDSVDKGKLKRNISEGFLEKIDVLDNGEALVYTDNISKYFPLNSGLLTSLFGGKEREMVHAVDRINICIKKGSIVGIVGETGSGKSTLGRVAVRSVMPTDGHLYFSFTDKKTNEKYRNVDEITPESTEKEFLNEMADLSRIQKSAKDYYAYRSEAQIIFQDPYDALNPKRTILDSLSQAIKLRIMTENLNDTQSIKKGGSSINIEKMCIDALETCDLSPGKVYLDRYPHELSGGERQRVCIARAIIINPTFLVADEPISMLDVSIRANILNLLTKLRTERNMSILYISHDIASARYISDYIMVMYLGQTVEFGTSEEVIKHPLHPYTKALILSVPDMDPQWGFRRLNITGEIGNAVNPEKNCRFYKRCLYRKSICQEKEPPLINIGNRYYRCHFTQDQLIENEEII